MLFSEQEGSHGVTVSCCASGSFRCRLKLPSVLFGRLLITNEMAEKLWLDMFLIVSILLLFIYKLCVCVFTIAITELY